MTGKNGASAGPRAGTGKKTAGTNRFEKAVSRLGEGRYVLRLYVAGTTPRSAAAIANLKSVCDEHLAGRYDLEVIDIYQLPALAKDHQIVAAPTLIKVLPLPLRRFIGDLSAAEKVLFGLDILPKE